MANIFAEFINGFRRQPEKVAQIAPQIKVKTKSLPPKGGRSSVSESANRLSIIPNLTEPPQLIPNEYIRYIEHLSIWNPDFSHTVSNIVELAITEHAVLFNGVGEAVKQKALEHLKSNRDKWYKNGDGFDGLLMDVFRQVVCSGAVSAERIPKLKPLLSGIDKIVMVSPSTIEFLYSEETNDYLPYQRPLNSIGVSNGLIELSITQYCYVGMQRQNENPKAIPPLLSGINNSNINDGILNQLEHIVKKYGLLGLLSMLVEQPALDDGEDCTDESYHAKCSMVLANYRSEIEAGLRNGVLLGFKDNHEFKLDSTVQGGGGVKDIWEINDTQMISGLKIDPTLLGRSSKTSEAFARVAFRILRCHIGAFQKTVANFIANTYLYELQMAGFNIPSLSVKFESVDMDDKEKEQNTEGKKIDNVFKKLDKGIISPEQAAAELGYDKPFDVTKAENKTEKKTPLTLSNFNFERSHVERFLKYRSRIQFDYYSLEEGTADGVFEFDDAESQALYSRYTEAVKAKYGGAIQQAADDLETALNELSTEMSATDLMNKVLYHVSIAFESQYVINSIVDTNINKGYLKFRKDKSIFAGKDGVKAAVLDMPDYRAIEFFKKNDNFYLDKFITDTDTQDRLKAFINEEYLTNGAAITHNREAISRFRKSLTKQLAAENWKIDRVIATTVNRIRTTAAVQYMSQENIEWFEIRGVNDKRQCAYCHDMQGRRFSVQTAAEKIDYLSDKEPTAVVNEFPFINTVFKKAADMKGLMDIEIQNKGLSIPPFHCFCRDTVIAVID